MKTIKLVAVFFIFIVPFSVLAATSKQKYKTYKNTVYGYSIKYPNHWRAQQNESGHVYFDYGKELYSIPDMSTAVSIYQTQIGPDSFYTSANLDDIAKTSVEMIEANKFGNRNLQIRIHNTKVAKIKAKQINYLNTFIYDSDFEMVQFLFVKDDSVWVIGGPAKEKGLQQILKSLKFIQRNEMNNGAKIINRPSPSLQELREPNLTEQFAALEKELLNSKANGKILASAHYERIQGDIDKLASRDYPIGEIARLRKLAQELKSIPQISPSEELISSPSPTPPPPAPAPTLPPLPLQQPPQTATNPAVRNSWVLPFSIGNAYDPATKSQGDISFAGEWVTRPFGGGRGPSTWQPGKNLDIEFELVPGTILRASTSGKVTFSKNPATTLANGGIFDPQDWELQIQLGDGTHYVIYDHVIDIRISQGEMVQAGSPLARASPASIRHGGSQGQKPVDEFEWGMRRTTGQATGLCPWDYLTETEQVKFTGILETMRSQGFGAGTGMCLKQEVPG